jgi:hypothetical protein
MTQCNKNGKTGNERKKRLRKSNDTRVQDNNWLSCWKIQAVSSHDTKSLQNAKTQTISLANVFLSKSHTDLQQNLTTPIEKKICDTAMAQTSPRSVRMDMSHLPIYSSIPALPRNTKSKTNGIPYICIQMEKKGECERFAWLDDSLRTYYTYHCNIGESTRPLDPKCYTKKDDEPHQE